MKNVRKKLRSPWLDAFLAFISAVIGLFAGKFLDAIVPPLFALSNLPYIAFILIAVLFLADVIYSITLWRSTQDSVADVADRANELAIAVGHRVKTVTYSEGYRELEKRIKAAEKEILILTEYGNIFDWENKKPIWDSERMNSPQRKSFYESIQKKLRSERISRNEKNNGNFRFVKIVQIPENHKIEEMLIHDPLYAADCQFIIDTARGEVEFASLRVSGMLFSNSIIIIDGSFAHISFDVHKPKGSKDNEVDAPFVMLIDDPKSDALQNLLNLYRRVEGYSTIIPKLEFKKYFSR